MGRNVEIKARVDDLDRVGAIVAPFAHGEYQVLNQEDVFFPCRSGRLKLRIFSDSEGELIYYERPDTPSAKQSRYTISRTCEPETMRDMLSAALGTIGVVRKSRILYIVGQTRVHLDAVEGLGTFIELEVVLRPDQTEDEGRAIADHLADTLGIREEHLVSVAYVDLLTK